MSAELLNLYIQLREGEAADLAVVARAALAFEAAIKEAAYVIDPSLQVRVELASGTRGSLSLNSIIRSLRGVAGDRATLRAIQIAVLSWFALETGSWAFSHFLDEVFYDEAGNEQTLSEEEMDQISSKVARLLSSEIAKPQIQQVYRELQKDPAVTGVGVGRRPGERPSIVVPRTEFAERGGTPVLIEETVQRRRSQVIVDVVLISPVLVHGDRRWKFLSTQGEFGASVRDKKFLERVLNGTVHVEMKAGIEMQVELETVSELKDGVWQIVERNVLSVLELREPPSQKDLFLTELDEADGDD